MNKLSCQGIVIILILWTFSSVAQPKAEIRISEGDPRLIVDGKPCTPFAYMSYLGQKEYYTGIAKTGTHLYCFPAYLGDRGINAGSGIGPFRKPIWIGENRFDFSDLTVDFEKIIQCDPDARIIVRLHLDPPLWWEKLNRDASTQLADGSTFRQCFSSEKWRNETGIAVKKCIQWLLQSPYSKNLVGIHIGAGGTEEWFYHAPQRDDRNPARIEAFRIWLFKKYKGDVAALQKSWGDGSVSFDTALPEDINKEKSVRWRIPEEEQSLFDTFQFHSEVLAENITYFCRVVKEASNQTLLAGVFYGYHYYVTDPRAGHGALSMLLDCKDIDFFSSPNTYNRVIGEDWPPMSAIQSIKMHGKLWFAENDTRTCLTTLLKEKAPAITPPGQYESSVWKGPEDMGTSLSFLWKNAGRMLTHGYGGWWFDMWGGWFNHPELLNVISKTNGFYASFSHAIEKKMQPQVCVFYDEQLCFWDASYGQLTEQILSNRYPLGKTGAPYDLFLRSDEMLIPTDQYKVIWLMGFLDLKDDEKQKIEKWRKQGISVIWTHGRGTRIFKENREEEIKDLFQLTDSQLREIFRNAGVHIYLDSGDVFYIGRNWLCIHTVFGGKKTVNLPFTARITDPADHRIISGQTRTFELKMEPRTTLILRVEPL